MHVSRRTPQSLTCFRWCRSRIVKTLFFASAFVVVGSLATAAAAPTATENYSMLILGQWLGPRKIHVYHADGTWGVRRHERAPEDKHQRRWSIKGSKLTRTYPGERGTETGTLDILSLTADELILASDGYKERSTRLTSK
jgi:hypothetical protein